MNTDQNNETIAAALHTVCSGRFNPVAWMILDDAGFTKEALQEASASPNWQGLLPNFEAYPDDEFIEYWRNRKKEQKLMEYLVRICVAMSVLFNVLTGGASNQTFSARNWQWRREGRFNLVWIIDNILGKYHCVESWVDWETRELTNGIRVVYISVTNITPKGLR